MYDNFLLSYIPFGAMICHNINFFQISRFPVVDTHARTNANIHIAKVIRILHLFERFSQYLEVGCVGLGPGKTHVLVGLTVKRERSPKQCVVLPQAMFSLVLF